HRQDERADRLPAHARPLRRRLHRRHRGPALGGRVPVDRRHSGRNRLHPPRSLRPHGATYTPSVSGLAVSEGTSRNSSLGVGGFRVTDLVFPPPPRPPWPP